MSALQKLLILILTFDSITNPCSIYFDTLNCDGRKSNVSFSSIFEVVHDRIEVTTLVIAYTNLSNLQNGNISLPYFPGLSRLRLYSNGLNVFCKYVISNNTAIKELSLQNNKLTAVPVTALEVLANLTYLDLSRNEITVIERFAFRFSTSLQYLNVASNRVHIIQRHSLSSLVNLELLSFANNSIQCRYFFISEFSSLRNLKTLNLAHNNINLTMKANASFSFPAHVLYLSYNALHFLDDFALNDSTNLRVLFADNNNISGISPLLFGKDSINLTTLVLDHNELMTIPVFLIQRLPNLQTLSLSWNRVTVVPNKAFQQNTHLLSIRLSWNQIHIVQEMSLQRLISLKQLDLRFNNLTSLPPRLFDSVGDFSLLIGGNNFTCDCEIYFLQKWIKKTRFFVDDIVCLISEFENFTSLISFEFSDTCPEATSSVTVLTDFPTNVTPSPPTSKVGFNFLKYWKGVAAVSMFIAVLFSVVALKLIPKRK
ncbi:Leucine-rich repeat-containing G-protein coupled receptor 5 [Holothuria leucospilota]|uniref:Leucine-rich repeat-containing G-protein coupled receptor 5 n=1 Tax=Holothuria leucospilota TaxID=206669 RepID=A0A9Q1HHC4_HOLLE|nr:Leucine-rich repeat-containing G-protein coupled receptor 5 [Holothuria leucospilota]